MSLVDWCLLHCVRREITISGMPENVRDRERQLVTPAYERLFELIQSSRHPTTTEQRFDRALLHLWLRHEIRCQRWLGCRLRNVKEENDGYVYGRVLYLRFASKIYHPRFDNRNAVVDAFVDSGLDLSDTISLASALLQAQQLPRRGEKALRREDEALLSALEDGHICYLPPSVDYRIERWSTEQKRRLLAVPGHVVATQSYGRFLDSRMACDRELMASDGFSAQAALLNLVLSMKDDLSTEQIARYGEIRDRVVASVPPERKLVFVYFAMPGNDLEVALTFARTTLQQLHRSDRLDLESTIATCLSSALTAFLLSLPYSVERLCELVREAVSQSALDDQSGPIVRLTMQIRIGQLIEVEPKLGPLLAPLQRELSALA